MLGALFACCIAAWSSSRWTGCCRFAVFAFKEPTLRPQPHTPSKNAIRDKIEIDIFIYLLTLVLPRSPVGDWPTPRARDSRQ